MSQPPATLGRASSPAFILCGGLGTRLGASEATPKPIAPVCGLPFLFYVLDQLASHELRHVHLLLGAGAASIVARLGLGGGNGSLSSMEQTILRSLDLVPITESEPLGTGGALAQVRDRVTGTSLVLNGDSYAEADLRHLLDLHASLPDPDHGATLLGVWREDRSDYGGLVLDDAGRVAAFSEKGTRDSGWVNGGVAAIGREIVRTLPSGPSSLERDLYPGLAALGVLHMWGSRGFFCDIGTPDRLEAAQRDFEPLYRRIAQKTVQSHS